MAASKANDFFGLAAACAICFFAFTFYYFLVVVAACATCFFASKFYDFYLGGHGVCNVLLLFQVLRLGGGGCGGRDDLLCF